MHRIPSNKYSFNFFPCVLQIKKDFEDAKTARTALYIFAYCNRLKEKLYIVPIKMP
jgi:hypothetical protein